MSRSDCAASHSSVAHPAQRIIGLTGGIGMGKTTVSNYLATAHHLPILDADVYAREAVALGSALLGELASRYGSSLLLSNGELNRVRLGEIVFSSRSELQWLEQQIHPFVRDRMATELKTLDPCTHPTLVIVIPLLFEVRMTDLVTEIWVVHCDRTLQVERLRDRALTSPLTLDQIHARIDSQMPIAKKIRRAHHRIENNDNLEGLFSQIDQALHSCLVPDSIDRLRSGSSSNA